MGVPFGAPYAGQAGNFANADAQQAVILESLAYGNQGGNDQFATFRNPGAPNAPLAVSVTGNDLVVDLATDANGASFEHGGSGRERDQRHPGGAAATLKAFRYRGFAVAGTGIAQATPRSRLSDLPQRAGARPARAVPGQDAADRRPAHRDEGRRIHLLPAARARVGGR